jgi:hypothetical protein
MSLRLDEPTNFPVVQDLNTGWSETGSHILEETTQVHDQVQDNEVQAPDRVAKAISAFCLVDQLDVDEEYLAPDMAFKSTEAIQDESKFKDIFEAPKSFNDAWNHKDPFQRDPWREAIKKEFEKMELNKVWKKVKRTLMPEGRRCVKHNGYSTSRGVASFEQDCCMWLQPSRRCRFYPNIQPSVQ